MTNLNISEDDFANLSGLAFAIEVCSDALIGLIDEKTARRALPTLVRLQNAEINRLAVKIAEEDVA